ncbi:hypothetical protein AWB79_01278 [Caballeronia hypogeia]|uniref:Uncharacterized protein n=1 Tax=Caballeronia hypogeia TaxID=1777140 RepID=A0A157ZS33_9BURK|nr:hypothetical protein [Caballeronia hypogeia]SAK48323.1 hypothetical protein AWB79_01278 [Caballeronia hypogeia]
MSRHLTPVEWLGIEERYRSGAPAKTLAFEYGVAPNTIRKRASRESWRTRDGSKPASALDRLEHLTARLERLAVALEEVRKTI